METLKGLGMTTTVTVVKDAFGTQYPSTTPHAHTEAIGPCGLQAWYLRANHLCRLVTRDAAGCVEESPAAPGSKTLSHRIQAITPYISLWLSEPPRTSLPCWPFVPAQ